MASLASTLRKRVVAASADRRRAEIAAEGANQIDADVEIAGGFDDAQGGRVHDAGLEQDGGEMIVAQMLVERAKPAGLDQRIDKQLVGEPLGLRPRDLAFNEVTAPSQ